MFHKKFWKKGMALLLSGAMLLTGGVNVSAEEVTGSGAVTVESATGTDGSTKETGAAENMIGAAIAETEGITTGTAVTNTVENATGTAVTNIVESATGTAVTDTVESATGTAVTNTTESVTGTAIADTVETMTGSAVEGTVENVTGSGVDEEKNAETEVSETEEQDGTALTIAGKITPSVIETQEDISEIGMNKLSFPAEGVTEAVYLLNVKGKGGLYLAITQADSEAFQNLTLTVYSDSAMTKKVGKNYTLKQDTKVINTKTYYLSKAGTYYLKFTYTGAENTGKEDIGTEDTETEEEDAQVNKTFAMTAAFMYGTDRKLEEGKTLVSYADSNKRTVYYKIRVKKKGLVSFTAQPEDGTTLLEGQVLLCDKNKKAVSVKTYVSGSEDNNKAVHAYYAVKKGTYYINAKLNVPYLAAFTTQKVTDQAGGSMANAKKIKWKGKEKKSVLFSEDSTETEKWYRLHLKKTRNFSIVVNSCVNGYLNIEVCNSAGIPVKSGGVSFYSGTKVLKTSSKWQKGGYYIKITKAEKSKKSSGYFSVSVKK